MHEYDIVITPKGFDSGVSPCIEAENAKKAYGMIYPSGYQKSFEGYGGFVVVERTDGNTTDRYNACFGKNGKPIGEYVFDVDDADDDLPMITAYNPADPEGAVWHELIDIDHCCLSDTDSDARAQTTVDAETAELIRDYVTMQLESIACRTEAHLWYTTDGKYDGAGDCDTHAIRLELLFGVECWSINN